MTDKKTSEEASAGTLTGAEIVALVQGGGDVKALLSVVATFFIGRIADVSTGPLVLAADPVSALHAATKQYVDNLAAGLDIKASAKCATTANITLSGEQTIDGVATSASRVLVKNQSAPAQNGLYLTGAGAWSRTTDMDAWTEVPGANLWVEEGTVNADTSWVCTANAGGTLNTTAINWTQFGGTGLFQPIDSDLTAIAALATTSYGRSCLTLADGAGARVLFGVVIGTDVAAPADVQIFTSSGTWTKPAGAKHVRVFITGGGGGGGGGCTGNTGTFAPGGGAGGGGYGAEFVFNASALGSTETVTVGTGGAGGAPGASGSAGGNSSFGSLATAYAGGGGALGSTAAGGGGGGGGAGGAGGSATTVTGGTAGTLGGGGGGTQAVGGTVNFGGGGGAGSLTNATGANGGASSYVGPAGSGGGSGGGPASTNVVNAAGNGGATRALPTGATAGATGAPGTSPSVVTAYNIGGPGGGGGGGELTANGGAGGTGAIPGGGGGGGGGTRTGFTAGAGGAGGDGRVVVITSF